MRIFLPLCLCVLLASFSVGQIVTITAPQLITPTVLDFDTGAPAAGNISPFDPYFLGFGLAEVNIVNAPGVHTPAGDLLSSGFIGSCLASVNNTLAIVAPNGPMDNHTLGAGWKFVLTPGTVATQFGGLIVDQINHMMSVETWFGGILQNTYTFTMTSPTGGFPNPYIYFEDLSGFDEVRFQNVGVAGGWGIDEFTLGNATTGGTVTAPLQVNQANASIDINGVTTTGFAAAVSTLCTGTGTALNMDSALPAGTPYDVGVAVGAVLNPGAASTAGGQQVNLNLGTVALWLSGGLGVTIPWVGAATALPFNSGTSAVSIHAQGYWIDPTNSDGLSLSQASQLDVLAGGGAQPGPAGDDQSTLHGFGSPLCAPFSVFNFYGAGYSDMYVHSNGEVCWGAGNTDFSASVAEFDTQMPRICGLWSDLSPNAGGSVTVTPSATDVTVTWAGVPGFGAATANSFDIVIDVSGGTSIANYAPDPAHAIGSIVGISNGSAGTPGAAISYIGLMGVGPQVSANASDSVYEFNAAGAPPAGWTIANFPASDGSLYTVN